MSNFNCEHCDTPILDSPLGYTTGCEHYPADAVAEGSVRRISRDAMELYYALGGERNESK